MTERKYLIYIDVLGFNELPEKIERETGIDQRLVRERFVNVLSDKIKALREGNRIVGEKYGQDDDWLLVADSFDKVFASIYELLDHYTAIKGYERIPLRIAIGTGEYDKWARFDGKNLIFEKSTIGFLKTEIINYYQEWYKTMNDSRSPTDTYIILTKSAFDELEPLDRKWCLEIENRCKKRFNDEEDNRVITFLDAEVERVLQRGRVFQFLEKLGALGSRSYDRIDDLYVHPIEYDDIKRVLEKDQIVFITGTKEYGKTYTAIRLLWEYFNRGYTPLWWQGDGERERAEVRRGLRFIEERLAPHCVIYFEDPFGKERYEGTESLEREIGRIIESVRNVNDAYVIITSREEVFKEFERERISSAELEKFEQRLNIKKPSYDYERRKEMLLQWAEARGCKWLAGPLSRVVLRYMRKGIFLPTPLNIRDFVISTANVTSGIQLIEKMKEKSKETAMSFAREIKEMADDKILFLSFFFVSGLSIRLVRAEYEKLVMELDIAKPWEFGTLLDWFMKDKIDVTEHGMGFSHPSYREALNYLLTENGRPTRVNRQIISKVLVKLSARRETARNVALIVRRYFVQFPDDIRDKLLLSLSLNYLSAYGAALTLIKNFDKIEVTLRDVVVENLRHVLQKTLDEFSYSFSPSRLAVFQVISIVWPEAGRESSLKILTKLTEVQDEAMRRIANRLIAFIEHFAVERRTPRRIGFGSIFY